MAEHEIPEGTVTVLFTDLVGSTELNQSIGDDAARQIGRDLERLAAEAIESNRGAPIKGLGDGEMAAFASARRAVACAREIQRGVDERNRRHPDAPVEMRIGLHTGEVLLEDGDLHGETVIIAKRIEGVARPGTIYASDTVHGVLGTMRDELVDVGDHQLKGIAASWRLYEVPWEPDQPSPDDRAPYVGRADELALMRESLQRAARGHGSLLLVSGDAGVGKSRLVAETLAAASSVDAVVLVGQCLDMTPAPPFQPIVDHLAAAGRALDDVRFREVIGQNGAEVATFMPSIRQRFDDLPEPPPLPPDQERQYVLQGMTDFIERGAAGRPLVLVYEDLHWADESTLAFLQTVAPRLADLKIMAIATHRPVETEPDAPLARALPTLQRHDAARRIELRNLDRDDVIMLLEVHAPSPPASLVDLVMAESDGNPYFVEELFRHLVETGKAFDESRAWRTDAAVGETEVPRSIQLLVARRLDGLDAESRKHLAVAALIGRTFAFDLLDAVSKSDEDDLFDALEDAERNGLIEEATTGREASYRFTHELVRQTLLGDLSLARRQRVHLRVAEALGEATGAHSIEISHHVELAGGAADDGVAAAAHLAAAETSYAAVAFEDALVQIGRAEERLDDDPAGMAGVLSLRARCEQGLARVEDALASLRRALGLVDASADAAFDLRCQRMTLLLDLFRGTEALDEVGALTEHPRMANPTDELQATLLVARTHYILTLDDPDHAQDMRDGYERAHALAVELGDDELQVRSLLPTVWFPDYWGDYGPQARRNVEEAIRLSGDLDDVDLALDVEIASFQISFRDDRPGHARELLAKLEERRDPLRLKEHCFILMWFFYAAGDFDDAVAICDRGIELAGQLGAPPVMYGSLKTLSLVEAGRYDEVDAALAQECTGPEHPFGKAMSQLARTYFLSRIGAWEPALGLGVDAFEALGRVGRVRMQYFPRLDVKLAATHLGVDDPLDSGDDEMGRTFVALGVSQLALASGDLDRIVERVPERISRLDPDESGRELGLEHLALAEAARRLGSDDLAASTARAGIELAERKGHRSILWRLRSVLGAATGDEGVLAAARTEFGVLRDRIPDVQLRACFERSPGTELLDTGR